MQTKMKIPVVIPVVQLFALFRLLELSAGLCPSSPVVSEVAYA
jgi:hypothetical protein